MKRMLLTTIIMSCLLLSACTKDTSLGVIGGADGPTQIYITSENGETEKKPIRMIKVDGKLYYDSGKVSDMTPRCGTLDGELKQVGEEYEIPQKDGECNFEGAEGYQNATSITKEIPIDGNWVIFKQFDDPELDMSIYKYCFYLKGRAPNAAKDNEIVVLTEDINYNYAKHNELFYRQHKYNPGEKQSASTFRLYDSFDKWGISLLARNVTSKGLTIECEQFGGSPTGELQTGDWYSLEMNEGNEWKPVNKIQNEENVAWHAIAYSIAKNEVTEFEVNWEWLYGELPPGFYRMKKEITDFRATGDYDKELYDMYFTIGE